MEKLFNIISVTGAAIGGAIATLLGGWDKLIIALLILIVLDYSTGLIKAITKKELSSEIGLTGILKKVLILIIVAVACVIRDVTNIGIIREVVITFFVCNEGISIMENSTQVGLPLPPKLKDMLLQLRDKGDSND